MSDTEGEICLRLADRPPGLTEGYADDEAKTSDAMRGGYYHTGDIASRDAEGYLTFVGRSDDVFKASDYRLSPFELESVLIEHPAVAEAAVVPSPDPLRHAVPKAFVVLAPGAPESPDTTLTLPAEAFLRLLAGRLDEAQITIDGKASLDSLRRLFPGF
jgi:acetyl-CoA synthetase